MNDVTHHSSRTRNVLSEYRHVLTVDQFSKEDIIFLCEQAYLHAHSRCRPKKPASGKLLANLFYEPSSRTFASFYSAMKRLGGDVIPINNPQYSSAAKGETLEDTIKTLACYVDAIVLRHPEVGAASLAASVSNVPIINAGDGIGEHPTQALLDLFTILQEKSNKIEGLKIVMTGDLLHGRTVKSLSNLLRLWDVEIAWVSPEELRIPETFRLCGEIETDDLASVIEDADVLYVTRVQKERMTSDRHYHYEITRDHIAIARPDLTIMHPLPRTTELPKWLDDDPRSAYFRQMQCGLYMRMAILAQVLS